MPTADQPPHPDPYWAMGEWCWCSCKKCQLWAASRTLADAKKVVERLERAMPTADVDEVVTARGAAQLKEFAWEWFNEGWDQSCEGHNSEWTRKTYTAERHREQFEARWAVISGE